MQIATDRKILQIVKIKRPTLTDIYVDLQQKHQIKSSDKVTTVIVIFKSVTDKIISFYLMAFGFNTWGLLNI